MVVSVVVDGCRSSVWPGHSKERCISCTRTVSSSVEWCTGHPAYSFGCLFVDEC